MDGCVCAGRCARIDQLFCPQKTLPPGHLGDGGVFGYLLRFYPGGLRVRGGLAAERLRGVVSLGLCHSPDGVGLLRDSADIYSVLRPHLLRGGLSVGRGSGSGDGETGSGRRVVAGSAGPFSLCVPGICGLVCGNRVRLPHLPLRSLCFDFPHGQRFRDDALLDRFRRLEHLRRPSLLPFSLSLRGFARLDVAIIQKTFDDHPGQLPCVPAVRNVLPDGRHR